MVVREKRTDLKFYNVDKAYSYNAVLNFIVGARGLGKTYGFKVKAIKRFLRHGEQFIYLRRYKTELDTRTTFMADILPEFPDHMFRVQGAEFQIARKTDKAKDADWKTAGFFIALSTAQKMKSVSYNDVFTIIYDEFIIEKGALHYLPNEFTVLLNFYNTVDRYRDQVRVWCLANSVTMTNPYFLELDIKPDQMGENTLMRDGFVYVAFPDASEFRNGVMETRFGRFIAGTEYEEYAVQNTFLDANDNFVKTKDFEARYRWTLETKAGIFSIWWDPDIMTYYLSSQRPKVEKCMTMIPERVRPGWIFAQPNDTLIQMLRTGFSRGRMFFDQPKTRNAFLETFKGR